MSISSRRGIRAHGIANLRMGLLILVPVLMILGTSVRSYGLDFRNHPECSDGYDNDNDGHVDYPRDDDCFSLDDNSEGPSGEGLFVDVSDGRDTVRPGGSLTYRITLQSDRDETKEVDVRFRIPNQTNLLDASNAGRENGPYVYWDHVTVTKGHTRTLIVTVEVNPYAREDLLLVAEANVGAEVATDTTRVTGESAVNSPLQITVTDGRQTAAPGDELNYVIKVKNRGTGDRVYSLRTNLPSEVGFVSATGDFGRQGRSITWHQQTLAPGETDEYEVTVRLERRLTGFYSIVLRAYVANTGEQGSDTTYVHYGPVRGDLSIKVSADRSSVTPGDEITYTLHVENESNVLATYVSVGNALPMFTEFVSATEGGKFTGASDVRWDNITISPNGSRTLKVTARVRRDTPAGEVLMDSAVVNGREATSRTDVVLGRTRTPGNRTVAQDNVMLRKTADREEVRPGDTVTYTIYLRNTTGHTIRNIDLNDRLDERYMTVVSGADDAVVITGGLRWYISDLQPNEVWQRSYQVLVSKNARSGITLNNVVTIGGNDIASLSLTERVRTTKIGVVSHMPATGAGMDSLSVLLTSLLGAGQVFLQRRKFSI